MNLPWDKSYFKLCFYIIFTFMIIYIFKNTVDIIVYALMNMGGIYRAILRGMTAVLSVFSVIIIGFIIAYILNPPVEFLTRLNIKRGLSVAAAFFILIVIIGAIVTALVLNITDFGKYSLKEGANIQLNVFNSNIMRICAFAEKYNIDFIKNIKAIKLDSAIIYSIIKYMAQIFLGFIISIYFLKDKYKILGKLKEYYSLLPNKLTNILSYILKNLDKAFSGYIRGQLTDAVIMAALFSFFLSIAGVPFSIPIGILSGLLNIIPYFGGISGFVIAVGITLLSGNYMGALYAAVIMFLLQQLDSIYISPKVVGESVRLSPVAVIIALAVSSNIFGIVGMVFAVPVVSFFKILLNDYLTLKNKDSDKS